MVMDATLQALESRARRAYEWGRLRYALPRVALVLPVVLVAALATSEPVLVSALGAALVVVGLLSLWRGEGFQRGLAPGVLVGLVPLAAVTCTARMAHASGAEDCMALCLGVCAAGGALAGLALGAWALRRAAPPSMSLTASGAALLTGAMGCTCVGALGLAALGLGFLAGAPLLALAAVRRGTSTSHQENHR
jgi:hypothetical protein